MTVEIKPDIDNNPKNKISIKIFKNGSIQMSGIKSIELCNTALIILTNELSKIYYIPNEGNNGFVNVSFVENNEKINISKFKVDMINSGFNIKYEINREKLYNLLLKNNMECKFEPSIHAGVNIKHSLSKNINKKVSIFVFESGNVIITGAKSIENIVDTYNYINNFLTLNSEQIKKNKIFDDSILSKEIDELLNINDDDDIYTLAFNESLKD